MFMALPQKNPHPSIHVIYANGRPVSTSTIHKRHTRFARAFIRIKNKNQFFAYCIINAINTKLGNSAATLDIFCSFSNNINKFCWHFLLHLFYMSSNLFSCLPFFPFFLSLSLHLFHLICALHCIWPVWGEDLISSQVYNLQSLAS